MKGSKEEGWEVLENSEGVAPMEPEKEKRLEEDAKAKESSAETADEPVAKDALEASNSRFVLTLWWTVFLALLAATAVIRFHDLRGSTDIGWDEVHFGKFGAWYINRTNFFDVHPPGGKMLIAGFGKLSGFNASFNFTFPGQSFDGHDGVVGLRFGCALFGAAILPLGFLTVWELTSSLSAATLAGLLLLFDTGFTVISRHILLDPLMIFFISAAFYSLVKFQKLSDHSFTSSWWTWLGLLGCSLAGAISVKFVGLFIILYVGVFTIVDLWNVFGDVTKGCENFVKHLVARVTCLIALPSTVYLALFTIHLWALAYTGPGDGFYSSLYQSTFQDSEMFGAMAPEVTTYGSRISLRASHNMPCGFLHSHQDLFPAGVGARQQMVTSYIHRDDNNYFTIKRNFTSSPGSGPVLSGDLVVLEHWATGRNLHSHKIPSVMAKTHFQVTGYGEDGVGDENDVWRIEVEGASEGDPVRPLQDKVRLRHHHLGCLLTCTTEQLPKDWSYGQMEVSCSPWQRQTTEAKGFCHSQWIIEESIHDVDNGTVRPVADIAPGVVAKLLESHKSMFKANKEMGTSASWGEMQLQAPWKWPLNLCSQRFSPNPTGKVVLFGAPSVWYTNLICLIICPFILGSLLFSSRRQQSEETKEDTRSPSCQHLAACAMLLGAWAVHYVPFLTMKRLLYIHHYYPAVYFSCLLSGVLLDYLVRGAVKRLPHQLKPVFLFSFVTIAFSFLAFFFNMYTPIVYGHSEEDCKLPNSTLHHLHNMNIFMHLGYEAWDF